MKQATNALESAASLIPQGAACAVLCKAVVLVVSLLGFAAQSVAECRITMRWDDDAPYFFPQLGHVAGIDADISREIMQRMGCNLSLVKLPWARALVELREGRIDMVSGAHRTSEREKYAYYASTVPTVSPNLLFIRRSDRAEFRFSGLREVLDSGFRLGAQINVSYSEEYSALVQDSRYRGNIEYTSRRDSLWRMLALNRIDGVIADKLTAMHEIQALGLSDRITHSSMVVSNRKAHYIFSKESVSPEFVADFDRALEAMQNDGTYSAIVHRYVCPSCRDMPD
ncbi:substrate-binding periplasmic protein [Marinobacter sp. DY40_1A1]|uniref:substrate-binding periplasmic protein n=1 Tax=Marinobacter sp. DY40_1A1 TaxID=2583229 RepID=UPI0019041DE7|nr:transporter substrate-binding domain-containing protein [Marinobacter sp. DY40_1A1]MBK1887980.1 transporter substrate-binding domain-containing protein [Marinobacter sp. DY40_1A1]